MGIATLTGPLHYPVQNCEKYPNKHLEFWSLKKNSMFHSFWKIFQWKIIKVHGLKQLKYAIVHYCHYDIDNMLGS